MCLYPVIDRFDWDNRQHWHNSGLWDLERDATGRMQRVLNEDYASELRRCMARLPASWAGPYGG